MRCGADVTQHIANGARLARLDKEYLDQQADKTMIEALGQITVLHGLGHLSALRKGVVELNVLAGMS